MKFSFHDVYTERTLLWHSIDPEIYDEDYLKENTLFGLFKITRRFKLKNNMNGTTKSTGEVKGFKK
jgi:hypothetical protein